MYSQIPIFNKLDINKAILLSIIIHALLLINLQWDSVEFLTETEIEINIQERKIKREIPKPIPKPIPIPIPKPKPITKTIEKPKPIEDIAPIEEVTPPLAEPEVKQVKELTTSEDVVEKKATNPNPQLINDYSSKLRAHIEKYKRYPRMAQIRGWNGQVLIQAEINSNGGLISSRIVRSSGRSILDKEGLAMMRRSIPFPIPPKDLTSNSFKITIPISFSLM